MYIIDCRHCEIRISKVVERPLRGRTWSKVKAFTKRWNVSDPSNSGRWGSSRFGLSSTLSFFVCTTNSAAECNDLPRLRLSLHSGRDSRPLESDCIMDSSSTARVSADKRPLRTKLRVKQPPRRLLPVQPVFRVFPNSFVLFFFNSSPLIRSNGRTTPE